LKNIQEGGSIHLFLLFVDYYAKLVLICGDNLCSGKPINGSLVGVKPLMGVGRYFY
jgi:hypothetical protein